MGNARKTEPLIPKTPPVHKAAAEKSGLRMSNEKDFDDDETGNDLDVPGSELDDELESIGSEDEENNYYSLGGDDHHDLDEEHEDFL